MLLTVVALMMVMLAMTIAPAFAISRVGSDKRQENACPTVPEPHMAPFCFD